MIGIKAQAAMEFLTNYGFVLLITLIIIGLLLSVGIIDTSTLLPEECSIDQGFLCQDYSIKENGDVSLLVTNKRGNQVSIAKLALYNEGKVECLTEEIYNPATNTIIPVRVLENGDTHLLTLSGCTPQRAQRNRYNLKISYYNYEDTRDRLKLTTVEGKLYAEVEESDSPTCSSYLDEPTCLRSTEVQNGIPLQCQWIDDACSIGVEIAVPGAIGVVKNDADSNAPLTAFDFTGPFAIDRNENSIGVKFDAVTIITGARFIPSSGNAPNLQSFTIWFSNTNDKNSYQQLNDYDSFNDNNQVLFSFPKAVVAKYLKIHSTSKSSAENYKNSNQQQFLITYGTSGPEQGLLQCTHIDYPCEELGIGEEWQTVLRYSLEGHIQIPSATPVYVNNVCCKLNSDSKPGTSIPTIILKASESTNAHAGLPNSDYTIPIEFPAVLGNVNCALKTACISETETALFSLSEGINAHLGFVGSYTTYGQKLCCSVEE